MVVHVRPRDLVRDVDAVLLHVDVHAAEADAKVARLQFPRVVRMHRHGNNPAGQAREPLYKK